MCREIRTRFGLSGFAPVAITVRSPVPRHECRQDEADAVRTECSDPVWHLAQMLVTRSGCPC